MAEIDLTGLITPGVITLAGGGLAGLGRWALRLWAEVRREGVIAAVTAAARREAFEREAAALQRADNARMVDALLAQARGSTELAAAHASLASKIDQLSTKLDTAKLDQLSNKLDYIAREREWTPVDGFERADPPSERHVKARTSPHGYRPPRAGTHSDDH